MRLSVLLLHLVSLVLAGCVGEAVIPNEPGHPSALPMVRGEGYEGVIIPAAMGPRSGHIFDLAEGGYYTVSDSRIPILERDLITSLEDAVHDPERLVTVAPAPIPVSKRKHLLAESIRHILNRLPDTRRQYLGIRGAEGRNLILITGFPRSANGLFPYWRSSPVDIRGVIHGNDEFWTITYDPEARTMRNLWFESSS